MLTTANPRFTIQPITCPSCDGACRVPDEREVLGGVVVVVSYKPCGTCLMRGVVRANVMESQEEPLCGKP